MIGPILIDEFFNGFFFIDGAKKLVKVKINDLRKFSISILL